MATANYKAHTLLAAWTDIDVHELPEATLAALRALAFEISQTIEKEWENRDDR